MFYESVSFSLTGSEPQEDVYDFPYEEGYKYTIWVREELKSPPIHPSSGIYNYILVKIVSKKPVHKNIKSGTTENNIAVPKPVSKNMDTLDLTINTKAKTDTVINTQPVSETKKEQAKTTTVKVETVKPVSEKISSIDL